MSLARRTEILLLIFAVLSGVLGGFAIWSYTHVGTLWFELFIVTLTIGFLTELAWIFLGTAVISLCFFGFVIQQALPPMPIAAPQGASIPTPAMARFRRIPLVAPNHLPTICLGSNCMAGFADSLLNVYGARPFQLHMENGRLYCDFNTYENTQSSEWPVTIKNDVVGPLPEGWDWNGNDNGVEIVDRNQNPVFQMYYENAMTVRVKGLFVVRGTVFIVDAEGFTEIPISSSYLPTALRSFKLKRTFKYPGAEFPGVPN